MQTFERWESAIRGYCRTYPAVFKSASNARQVDEEGRSYIDFFAGAGVLNFGHNNPRMKQAMIRFLEEDGVAHSLDMYTTAKRDFIERFAGTVLEPRGMDHKMQFMGPTGTNAVEAALKLARKVTGRDTVYAFSNGFHGMTLGSLACTANQYFRQAAGVPLGHVHRLPFDGYPGGGLHAIDELRCALADPSCGLEPPACVLVETIQAEGGVNIASQEWLQALQAFAREQGCPFIIDDIQVGCGRTGSYFSFDDMDLDPDIVCLAKGIGGFGTPLAMNLIRPALDQWQPGEHTGTFRGQGLSFVAGTEALGYFADDQLMQEVQQMGAHMRSRLETIAAAHPDLKSDVRGRGMIQALDLYEGGIAKDVVARCFQKGAIIGSCGPNGRVLKLIPPLTIPRSDLDEGLDILQAAVDEHAAA